jgi:hypothetical protein
MEEFKIKLDEEFLKTAEKVKMKDQILGFDFIKEALNHKFKAKNQKKADYRLEYELFKFGIGSTLTQFFKAEKIKKESDKNGKER